MRKLNNVLLHVFALLVVLIPIGYTMKQGIVNPFIHWSVASEVLSLRSGFVDLQSSDFRHFPSIGILGIEIARIGNVPPITLEYLPLGAVFLLVATYTFCRRLLHSSSSAVAFGLVIVLRWLPPPQYSMWPHTFGFALFLMFTMLFLRLMNAKSWKFLVVLWLVFLGIHFYSYTAEAWAIGLVGVATVLTVLTRGQKPRIYVFMTLSLLTTFLAFDQVLYESFFPQLGALDQNVVVGFDYLLTALFRTPSSVPYAWVPPQLTLPVLVLNGGYYGLLLSPLIYLAGRNLERRAHLSSENSQYSTYGTNRVGLTAFLLVWAVDLLSYASLGAVTVGVLRYGTLALPIIAAWVVLVHEYHPQIGRTSRVAKHAHQGFVIAALALTLMLFPVAVSGGYYVGSTSQFARSHEGANWLLSHSVSLSPIYSDLNTQGQYAIVGAQMGINLQSHNYYNSTSFGMLVNPDTTTAGSGFFSHRFIVVNVELASEKTIADTWIDYQPLDLFIGRINSNPRIAKVFDDGSSWILTGG